MTVRDALLAIDDETLRNGSLAEVLFVHMDFKDTPRRWWTGFGDVVLVGETWAGMGDLISVSGLTSTYSISATPLTFAIAATPEMIELSIAAMDRVFNRRVQVWSQLLTTRTVKGTSAWQPIGPLMSLFVGTMREMPMTLKGDSEAGIQLKCEGRFVDRNNPMHGRLTDADQKARHEGDKGLEYVAKFTNYETRWI